MKGKGKEQKPCKISIYGDIELFKNFKNFPKKINLEKHGNNLVKCSVSETEFNKWDEIFTPKKAKVEKKKRVKNMAVTDIVEVMPSITYYVLVEADVAGKEIQSFGRRYGNDDGFVEGMAFKTPLQNNYVKYSVFAFSGENAEISYNLYLEYKKNDASVIKQKDILLQEQEPNLLLPSKFDQVIYKEELIKLCEYIQKEGTEDVNHKYNKNIVGIVNELMRNNDVCAAAALLVKVNLFLEKLSDKNSSHEDNNKIAEDIKSFQKNIPIQKENRINYLLNENNPDSLGSSGFDKGIYTRRYSLLNRHPSKSKDFTLIIAIKNTPHQNFF